MNSELKKKVDRERKKRKRGQIRTVLELEIEIKMCDKDFIFSDHITEKIKKNYYCVLVKDGWLIFNSPIDYNNFKEKNKK